MPTLKDIRSAVARKCNDWVEIEVTDNGSTSTIISSIQGVESEQYYRGTEVYATVGTVGNLSVKRRVASSDDENFTLTLAAPLPAETQVGDVFEGYNIGGIGTRIRTYNAFISDAVKGLGAGARVLYAETLVASWDQDAPRIAIPEVFTHISGVGYEATDGFHYTIPHANSVDMDFADGWMLNQTNKTIRLVGAMSRSAHDLPITLYGAKAPDALVDDDDVADVHQDWVVFQTAAQILLSKDSQVQKNTGGMYQNIADSLRAMAVMPTPEGMVRVR